MADVADIPRNPNPDTRLLVSDLRLNFSNLHLQYSADMAPRTSRSALLACVSSPSDDKIIGRCVPSRPTGRI